MPIYIAEHACALCRPQFIGANTLTDRIPLAAALAGRACAAGQHAPHAQTPRLPGLSLPSFSRPFLCHSREGGNPFAIYHKQYKPADTAQHHQPTPNNGTQLTNSYNQLRAAKLYVKYKSHTCPALPVRQRVVYRRTHGGYLRGIALLGRGAGAVRVHFRGGLVTGLGHAGAQTQLSEWILDHAFGHHR